MKKIFSLIAAIAFAGSMMAADATIAKGTTNSYDDVTVNGKAAIKMGKSSAGGNMTITVGKEAVKLTLHAVAWNNEGDQKVTITAPAGVTATPDSIVVKANSNLSGTAKAFEVTPEADYLFTITLSGVGEEGATLTLASAKRAVVWSAKWYKEGEEIDPELEPEPKDSIVVNPGDTLTCAQAAAAALAGDTTEVYVKGYVTNIAYAWKDGSMSFWMADSLKGGNIFEAYSCKVDSALAPNVTDLVVAHGKLTKYNTTPELAKGCTVEIIEKGPGPEIVDIDVVDCKSAAEAALSVTSGYYKDGQEFTVPGYVTSIYTAWKDGVITFWMADTQDGGDVLEAYKCAIANQTDAPNVGDKVSVTGKLTKYNTTPEFAEGCTCTILERSAAPQNLGEKTIAEFLALKNTKDTCILQGTIANLPEDKTANAWKYGNFDLVDATDSIYIYGLLTPEGVAQKFAEMGLENGSTIKIKAIYTEYQGNPQVKNAILIEDPADIEQLTVAEAAAIALALGDNEATTKKYAVRGYVTKVYEAYNSQYKNLSFYMTDAPDATFGELQCRRAKVADADSTLAAGDHVLIIGQLTNNFYNDKNTAQIYQGQASVEWKQAIEDILVGTKVDKVIVEGVVYIVRDGKIYNVQGVQVH